MKIKHRNNTYAHKKAALHRAASFKYVLKTNSYLIHICVNIIYKLHLRHESKRGYNI